VNALLTPEIEQFKEKVRQEWTDPANVAAWGKWYAKQRVLCAAATTALLQAAHLGPGLKVLDIATGSGEPALTIAAEIGPTGHVTATDLSATMLTNAEKVAQQKGLTNITFRQADAHELPFPDQSFDRVTSRFGAMYFADAWQAFRETHRVLKPRGRVALVTWGPFEANEFFASMLTPIFKRVAVPPPPPGAPQPFKYARPDALAGDLREAGFSQVQADECTIGLPWPGPAEDLWNHFYDLAAPFRPVIDGLPASKRDETVSEIIANARRYQHDSRIEMKAPIVVATGVR
jgi:SAM-dependent methyltransferase